MVLRRLLPFAFVVGSLHARAAEFVEVRRFKAADGVQGVVCDGEFFYAIDNRAIGKYDKRTGKFVKRWTAPAVLPLVHLNSAIIRDGKIIGAHSNFPAYPEASSVEIWDAASLAHVASHSLGLAGGSLTWCDWHDGAWWACFARYTVKVNDDKWAKDARWTELVRFDRQWRRTEGWAFPPEVIARFEPYSSSGGAWGPAGTLYAEKLYVAGHDRGEIYELEPPKAGATLRYLRTLAAPIAGQAIAWDPAEPGVLWGIDRRKQEVVVMRLGEERGGPWDNGKMGP